MNFRELKTYINNIPEEHLDVEFEENISVNMLDRYIIMHYPNNDIKIFFDRPHWVLGYKFFSSLVCSSIIAVEQSLDKKEVWFDYNR